MNVVVSDSRSSVNHFPTVRTAEPTGLPILRNYIKFYVALERVTYHTEFGDNLSFEFNKGGDRDECQAAVDNDKMIQLAQNQFQPPGRYYTFDSDPPTARYLEMNKENVLDLINPASAYAGDDPYVAESPRETWSHGE